jgi:hypothetical protein
MAFLDANLTFTGGNTGSAQSITSSAVGSTGVLDLATGLITTASTYAAAPNIIGNASAFAESLGEGSSRLESIVSVGTALTGGTSLTIAIQGAVDAASGSYPANISGLTWVTLSSTGAYAAAKLTANALLEGPDWASAIPALIGYRFVRLLYTPAGTFGAGNIAFAAVGRFPSGYLKMAQKASGFQVAG